MTASIAAKGAAAATRFPRVAIIGGGAAGLAAARVLTRSNPTWDIRVLEKRRNLGGVWSYVSSSRQEDSAAAAATTTAVEEGKWHPMYRNLRTNLPKEVMGYREFPWLDDMEKNGGKSFMTHEQVLQYLNDYANHFELTKYIEWGATVTNLKMMINDSDVSGITTTTGVTSSLFPLNYNSDGQQQQQSECLKWPVIELEWSVATSTETDEDPNQRKNGDSDNVGNMNNNNREQQQQFCEQFDAVCICNGHYSLPVLPKLTGLQENFKGRVMHSVSYDNPTLFKDQVVLCVGGRASGSDIAREIAQYAKHVYLSDSTAPPEPVSKYNVTWVPKTKSVLSDGSIVFGGTNDDVTVGGVLVDTIIFCTGYEYQFDFIKTPETTNLQLQVGGRRVAPLYEQLWHATYPNLVFVGLPHSVVPFPLMELQMEAVERQWKQWDGESLPSSQEERLKAAELDATSGGEGKRSRPGGGRVPEDTHYLGAAQWEYCRRLARYAGMCDETVEDFLMTNKTIYDHTTAARSGFPAGPDEYREINYRRDEAHRSFSTTTTSTTTATLSAKLMVTTATKSSSMTGGSSSSLFATSPTTAERNREETTKVAATTRTAAAKVLTPPISRN